jgi:hypothetical protein
MTAFFAKEGQERLSVQNSRHLFLPFFVERSLSQEVFGQFAFGG